VNLSEAYTPQMRKNPLKLKHYDRSSREYSNNITIQEGFNT